MSWYLVWPGIGALTGAITYYEEITYEEICSFTIRHELLEQNTGYLFARSHEGLITHLDPIIEVLMLI